MMTLQTIKIRSLKHHNVLYSYKLLLIISPFLLLVFLFNYLPIHGWIYAFFDYQPGMDLFKTQFVGLKNFTEAMVNDSYLWIVLRNTLVLSLLNLLMTPVPVLFAILLSELGSRRFKRIIQTISTIPYYVSWIIAFSLSFSIFSSDGLIYQILTYMGVNAPQVNILGNSDIAWFFQILINLWKTVGYTSIIYFSAITSIDTELYDAGKVDGANRFDIIRHITIPSLMPTYFVLLVLGIASVLSNGFDQYFVFYNPMVAEKIEVLDYYVYNIGLKNNNIPFSTAVGIYKTLISILLLFLGNGLSKKVRGEKMF